MHSARSGTQTNDYIEKIVGDPDFAKNEMQSKEFKQQRLQAHINYMKYYNLWRDYDLLTTITANTGLLIQFL